MTDREKLACLLCKVKLYDMTVCDGAPDIGHCLAELEAADRIIAAGWKSPDYCANCIEVDGTAKQWVREQVEQAREDALREASQFVGSYLRQKVNNGDVVMAETRIMWLEEQLKSGIEPWRE